MARPVTDAMAEALLNRFPLGLLAEIEHPDGTARFWTGVGALSYAGYTWTGLGTLGGVSPVKQSSDIAIQEIQFALAGVDPEIAATLDDDVRNRSGKVWLACFDDAGQVVPDPYLVIDSQLDFQTLSAGDDGAVALLITARSGFYTLDRGVDEAWTPENQHALFADDTGLDMIPGLQNQDIQWKPA